MTIQAKAVFDESAKAIVLEVLGEDVNLQTKTVAPTTASQEVTPDAGFTGLSKVTVEAVTSAIDEDIVPENIKKDVDILGVVGTLE